MHEIPKYLEKDYVNNDVNNCFIDKPEVTSSTQNPYKVTEGQTASLECRLTDANPSSNITWQWYKTGSSSSALYNRPVFNIANIKRNMSGSYSCTASNSVGTSVAFTIYVDVLCK